MINEVIIFGRLTKDPTLRKTQNGTSVTSFTVACNRKVAQGQEPQADYVNCVAWNKTADIINQYLHKGSLLGVEGRIQTRNYDDSNGKRVYVTEVYCEQVVFLESKQNNAQAQNNAPQYEPQFGQQPQYQQQFPTYQQSQNPYQNYGPSNATGYAEPNYSTPALDISADDLPF